MSFKSYFRIFCYFTKLRLLFLSPLNKYLILCYILALISSKLFADDFAALPECTTRSVPNVLFPPTTFSISEPINVCAGSDIVITATGGDDLDLAVCSFCAPDRCAADPRGPNSCLFARNTDKKVTWMVWGDSSSYIVGYYGTYNENCIVRTPSEPGDTCYVLAYRMEATTAYDGSSSGDHYTFDVVAPPYEDYTIAKHSSLSSENFSTWEENFDDATTVYLADDENENINQNQGRKYDDTHCCTGIKLTGTMNTFTNVLIFDTERLTYVVLTLDIIDDTNELNRVLYSVSSNVKLVNMILWDGEVYFPNGIVGLATIGQDNIILSAGLIDANKPANIVLAHEYIHTAGLKDVGDDNENCVPSAHPLNVMMPQINELYGDCQKYILPCQCSALVNHR